MAHRCLEVAKLISQTLAGLDVERSFVVHGAEGWDEPTPVGEFTVFDVRPGRVDVQTRAPADYGIATCTASICPAATPDTTRAP